jgi:glycine/D-amino acid oxidase-like deaminating enzyme
MGTFIVANTFGRHDLRNIQVIEKELARFKAPYESVDEREVPGYHPNERYLPRKILWLPQEGFVDTLELSSALDVATESHARFSCEECFVDRLILRGGKVCGVVLSDGRELEGDHVVLAAGVGTQALLESLPEETRLPFYALPIVTSRVVFTLCRGDEEGSMLERRTEQLHVPVLRQGPQ